MGILWTILMGALTGWLAGKIMKSQGGWLRNIIIGVIGGFVSTIAILIWEFWNEIR